MTLDLVHRVSVPEGEAGQLWPAVAMVHGWQGNENVMSIFERTVRRGVAIVSPRAPLRVGEAQYAWFTREDDRESFEQGLAALSSFLHGLPNVYPIDSAHVVLMGFSQGAAMSYALLLSEPAAVEGVAGLTGFLPEPASKWLAPGRLAGKPVFIAHGRDDETVPIERARATAKALEEAGAVVAYHEYGIGHKLSAAGMADLKGWLARRFASKTG